MSYDLTEWAIENLEDVLSILTGYGDNLLHMYVASFAVRNALRFISLK